MSRPHQKHFTRAYFKIGKENGKLENQPFDNARKVQVKRKKLIKPVAVTKRENKIPLPNMNLKKLVKAENSASQGRNRSTSNMSHSRKRKLQNNHNFILADK